MGIVWEGKIDMYKYDRNNTPYIYSLFNILLIYHYLYYVCIAYYASKPLQCSRTWKFTLIFYLELNVN